MAAAIELTADDVRRFWSKVAIGGPDDCWEYVAGRNDGGYGYFKIRGRKHGAHRVAFVIGHEEQPGRLMVLHDCDNRPCCNPNHLFLGTNDDNMRDMVRKGRAARGERNVKNRIKEPDIPKIRRSTASNAAEARKHKVCPATISHIRTGRNWKHVAITHAR